MPFPLPHNYESPHYSFRIQEPTSPRTLLRDLFVGVGDTFITSDNAVISVGDGFMVSLGPHYHPEASLLEDFTSYYKQCSFAVRVIDHLSSEENTIQQWLSTGQMRLGNVYTSAAPAYLVLPVRLWPSRTSMPADCELRMLTLSGQDPPMLCVPSAFGDLYRKVRVEFKIGPHPSDMEAPLQSQPLSSSPTIMQRLREISNAPSTYNNTLATPNLAGHVDSSVLNEDEAEDEPDDEPAYQDDTEYWEPYDDSDDE